MLKPVSSLDIPQSGRPIMVRVGAKVYSVIGVKDEDGVTMIQTEDRHFVQKHLDFPSFSDILQEAERFCQAHYIKEGYLFSEYVTKEMIYKHLREVFPHSSHPDNLMHVWNTLLANGSLVRRDCNEDVYELPLQVRHKLINSFNLEKKWKLDGDAAMYEGEVQGVREDMRELREKKAKKAKTP